MDNPYNPTQAEVPYRPCRIREAQEYTALRRFHYLMLLLGILILIQSAIGWSNMESNVDAQLRAQPRGISKIEKANIEETLSNTLTWTNVLTTAAGVLIIICALAVFHQPLLATATAFVIYLSATLFILWQVVASNADRINLPGLAVKGMILTGLLMAMITATRFERDFDWRRMNPDPR